MHESSPSVDQRRLDELAWLLEGTSMCAAVSVINSSFYIASNDFFSGTEKRPQNKQVDYFCKIMEYFRDLANGKIEKNNQDGRRDELIMSICKAQIAIGTFGRTRVDDTVFAQVARSKVLDRPFGDSFSSETHTDFLTRYNREAYLTYAYGLDVLRRIKKIEESIKKANKADFSDITPDELAAFKSFTHQDIDARKSNILFSEPLKDVHAELQVLTEMIKIIVVKISGPAPLPDEIYIGISKRCCLNCHMMLDAANEVLKKIGVSIRFEGAHDDEPKWICPSDIKTLAGSRRSQTASGQTGASELQKIYAEIKARYDEIRKKYDAGDLQGYANTSGGFETRRPRSDSEYSLSQTTKIEFYERQLHEHLESFLKFGVSPPETLLLGMQLCKLVSFHGLFESEAVDVHDRLLAINTELGRTPSIPNIKQLAEFLKNPVFSTPEIARRFADFNLDKIFPEEKSPEATTTASPLPNPDQRVVVPPLTPPQPAMLLGFGNFLEQQKQHSSSLKTPSDAPPSHDEEASASDTESKRPSKRLRPFGGGNDGE